MRSQSVHIYCRHTILAHLFFSLTPISLSLSLSLTVSLFLTPTHSPIYLSFPYSPHLSLSLSLSPSFPPFLSFYLGLFNLFNDHSTSPLSTPFHPIIITDVLTHHAFCVRKSLFLLKNVRLFNFGIKILKWCFKVDGSV